MSTVWSESDAAFGAGLRVLFVGVSSVRPELFDGVSGESGVEVYATDLDGLAAAVERHRPDVLVSDLDEIGERAYDVIGRARALVEEAGESLVAFAVGAAPRDRARAFAAGYEACCPRETVASEVVGLATGARGRGAAPTARAASFAAKQTELRRKLAARRSKLEAQHERLAAAAERRTELGRPSVRALALEALVRAPANPIDPAANLLLEQLPARELQFVLARLALVRLGAGKTLYLEGGRIDAVYFPLTCVVSHAVVTRGGKIFEAFAVGSEGLAGLDAALDAERSSWWTRVQLSGAALRMTTTALDEALEECPTLAGAFRRHARARIFELTQSVLCNRLHRVDGQLAKLLLTARDRVRSDVLPLTHERLSEALGTTRPSVTLAAQTLEDAGAIERSYGRIRVVDAERLRAAACECYEAIREELERPSDAPRSRTRL